MDPKKWLIHWLSENSIVTQNEIEKNLDKNYLDIGWIDSLKFVSFVTDIESYFKINFSNNEFQNKDFSTINGLAKIIEDKMNGKI